MYGTMDGRHTSSAGQVGFKVPSMEASLAAYRKLYQVSWRPAMAEAGYSGTHLTSGAADFVARYVAPLIVAQDAREGWSKGLIETTVGAPARTGDQDDLPPASQPATAPADDWPLAEVTGADGPEESPEAPAEDPPPEQ
jgi:hypothetical protein